MMTVLSVGSLVGLHSSIVTNLMDIFPNVKYWKMAGITSTCGFLAGLVYVTPGGQWVLNLVDHFGATFLVFALAIMQLLGVFWIYGLENFCWDLEFMSNRKVTPYWRISWFIVTPIIMLVIFIYNMVVLENPTYMSKPFPTSSLIAGWFIFSLGVSQILIWALWIATREDFPKEGGSKFKALFKPNPEWGPKSLKTREAWISYKAEKLEDRKMQANGHSKLKQLGFILLRKY